MSPIGRARQWRGWVPVPRSGLRPHLFRWVLLEGNRLAVTGALLTVVFVGFMLSGMIWTFELQQVLTETPSVENVLDTFLSGIILLVSIVVSINSIALSQDITSVDTQEERVRGAMDYRREISALTDDGATLSNPASFLREMVTVIEQHAEALGDEAARAEGEDAREIQAHADSIAAAVDEFTDVDVAVSTDLGVLWEALEFDYGSHMERSRALQSDHGDGVSDPLDERFEQLVETLELFATGREYFKSMYYTNEVSRLSRTLLVVSLPAIVVTATAILAINAGLLPGVWLFGLPPLQSFVATMFTVSLAPYIVLTSFMLRLSTVATETAHEGLFSI